MESNNQAINDLAKVLKDLKEAQKQFKKDNKELFKENSRFNKEVKAAVDELVACMRQHNETLIVYDGMEFEIKQRVRQKHDMEALENMFGDESKLGAYKELINQSSCDVSTRKNKKHKVDDSN